MAGIACAQDGTTALATSCIVGRLATVDILLRAGADVNAAPCVRPPPVLRVPDTQRACRDGSPSPLMLTAKEGHGDVIAALLRARADANFADAVRAILFFRVRGQGAVVVQDGDTALMLAAVEGRAGVIQELLLARADVNHMTEVARGTARHGTPVLNARVYRAASRLSCLRAVRARRLLRKHCSPAKPISMPGCRCVFR